MSRTIMRKHSMNKFIRLRAHEEDVANLKIRAQQKGMDVSAYVRQLLIEQGVLNAL